MLNGKELKNCSDDELLAAWLDSVGLSLATAIVHEVRVRRSMRAASQFYYPPDHFPV